MNLKWGSLNRLEEAIFMHVGRRTALNGSLFLLHLISDEETPDVNGSDALFRTPLASGLWQNETLVILKNDVLVDMASLCL